MTTACDDAVALSSPGADLAHDVHNRMHRMRDQICTVGWHGRLAACTNLPAVARQWAALAPGLARIALNHASVEVQRTRCGRGVRGQEAR